MNDEQHNYWLTYIRSLADLLDLRDWDIWLSRSNPETSSAWAGNYVFYGQRRCEIRIDAEHFADISRERQRYLLTHELLHCHSEGMAEAVRIYLHQVEGERSKLFEEYFDRQLELFIDSVATATAQRLPLPVEAN